jgi:hypothetical protein
MGERRRAEGFVERLLDIIDDLTEELRYEKSVNTRLDRQIEYLTTTVEVYQANKTTKFDPYI